MNAIDLTIYALKNKTGLANSKGKVIALVILVILVILGILGIALGVGLGVGLSQSNICFYKIYTFGHHFVNLLICIIAEIFRKLNIK